MVLVPAWGQTITTVAGNGTGNYAGDGGPATLAEINQPDDIAFDSLGNYYIADAGNVLIRKVTAGTGIMSTYAGGSTLGGYSGDGGPATLATFFYPSGIACDSHNNLFISDYYNGVIREVFAATGIIQTVVGNGTTGYSGDGGPAIAAELNSPIGIRIDAQNNLYIADSNNNVIRRVDAVTGIITTFAGTGVAGYSGNGGPATLAKLNDCEMAEPDSLGNLYISDFNNNVIREVAVGTGIITTVAGNGSSGYSGDGGQALLAKFSFDNGTMAFGCGGNLFMTDDMNNVIREVTLSTGVVRTVAGTGAAGYFGDGGPATLAKFDHTESIAFDQSGSLYVVDYANNSVRKITGLCGPTVTPTDSMTPSATASRTNTATSTSTWTASLTATPSASPTNTSTQTQTPTQTFTPTVTYTVTLTPTCTFSPTPSDSPTITATFTQTQTPTQTPTFTQTRTPTQSFTPTATFTVTLTPTLTFSPTPSNSPTITPTYTQSLTPTITPTITSTLTSTQSFTPTPTFTVTLTPTLTFSPTQSPTPSITPTPTVTPTTTPWITLGKHASASIAQSGDFITYSLSVTLIGGSFNNTLISDALPPGENIVSLSPPAYGTATFSAATSLITWVFPTPLNPGIYQLSYQVQIAPFVSDGTQIVNGATLSAVGLDPPLSASATVALSGSYTVQAGVYNEAGELICSLWTRKYSQPISSLDLVGGPITTLSGANHQINLYSGGVSFGMWNGMDGSGSPVVNGTYFVVIKSVDPSGVVTTVTRQAVVNRALLRIETNIYNEAGELVKHIFGWVYDSTGTQLTGVSLNQTAIQLGANGPAANVQLVIQTSGLAVTLSWDGTSDSGGFVTPGNYILSVHFAQGVGTSQVISRIVQVKGGETNGDGTVTACPNILTNAQGGVKTTFKLASPQPYTLRTQIYDTAGEMVAVVQGDPGTNQAAWDATGMASGFYIAVVELINSNGNTSARQRLKIVVIR